MTAASETNASMPQLSPETNAAPGPMDVDAASTTDTTLVMLGIPIMDALDQVYITVCLNTIFVK